MAQVRTPRTAGASPSLRALLIACTVLFVLAWQATPATAETVVSCPFNGLPGDNASLRGFYVTNYPGTNIDQVTLAYDSDAAGTYMITLTARTGTYDGPIIGTSTVAASLELITPVSFAFGGATVAQGSTITFSQSATGPGTLFFDTGVGPCPGVTETDGTTPPLDTFRRDSVGLIITQAPPAALAPPSNVFSFGRITRNKNNGTATLAVNVPGPGTLSLTGKGVKTQRTDRSAGAVASRAVEAAGTVRLLIKAKQGKKRKLNNTGNVKVKAKVTYTPTAGAPNTEAKRIKLIRKR